MRILIIILSLLIAACADQTSGAIKDFATVTNSSAEINRQLITEYKNTFKVRKIAEIAKANTTLNIEFSEDTPYIPELNIALDSKSEEQQKIIETSEQLTTVNDVLALYSVLLVKLAAAGNVEDINKASTNFNHSLTQINNSLKTTFNRQDEVITAKQIAAISSTIDTAAIASIDYYRNQKIKKVVNEANVLIGNIHKILVNDLANGDVISKVYYTRRDIFAKEVIDYNYIKTYTKFNSRYDELNYFYQKEGELSKASESNFKIGLIKNLDNIKDAHQKLTDQVNDNSLSDANLLILIEQISAYVNQYKKFNSSVNAN
ncbi:hypothetical protein AB8989_15470 [Yersinia hibernica]|uniref:Lipoprotein n=1 Tax=Yersinia hibernica TaxID=2339259 RepID=A0ABX5R284_9GAMM|nr:hypothetical protein [Yersinia hibernica]QAX79744.1 hypothetical protein D5F51_14980 [Yersinia hibernica]